MTDAEGSGFTAKSFDLLDGLADNNEKPWYDEHRDEIASWLRTPFADLLDQLTERLAGEAVPLCGSEATMFRMHRDVRFSEDKRPYKTSVSGLMTPDGTKGEDGPVLYLAIDREGGMVAAGFHKLSAKQLAPIRERIVADAAKFGEVRQALERADLQLADDDALKAMPRGFEQYDDHRHADVLRLKSLVVMRSLPKTAWTSGDVADRVSSVARGAMPLLEFGLVQ